MKTFAKTFALLLGCAALGACGGARTQPEATLTPAELSRQDGGIPPYTEADVHFMSGMIAHHAQAVLIAGWAPSHGASESLQALCERIVVGQQDEIALMQGWLRARGEVVPEGTAAHAAMPGMDHMMMPGMLTAEQLAALDRARGVEFDRLFLRYMIQHHEGAITMVNALFATPGAGQDDDIFRFATDVFADQTTEIERMGLMLAALPGEG